MKNHNINNLFFIEVRMDTGAVEQKWYVSDSPQRKG